MELSLNNGGPSEQSLLAAINGADILLDGVLRRVETFNKPAREWVAEHLNASEAAYQLAEWGLEAGFAVWARIPQADGSEKFGPVTTGTLPAEDSDEAEAMCACGMTHSAED